MKAFLTGSTVYGTPHKDSDIDLVVRLDVESTGKMAQFLKEKGEKLEHCDYGDGQTSIKIGALNLLVCHTDKRYISWALGTEALKKERMAVGRLTRERAIEVFSSLRDMLGLKKGKQ